MFCYQCQETARGTGCTMRGVCGKTEDIARIQDLLIYTTKGLAEVVQKSGVDVTSISKVNHELLNSLFMTITNANFESTMLIGQIKKVITFRDELKAKYSLENLSDAAIYEYTNDEAMQEKAKAIGVLATENEDIRSLKEMVVYGLKGMAAYSEHALNGKKENVEIYKFIYEALHLTTTEMSADELVALVMRTGEHGVMAMALLDEANTTNYGHPEITSVDIGVRNNPGILISGHDLVDLEQLLEQTKGTGVDVYTHSEMLPAHYYPAFKKYEHFAGNYGGSWWHQVDEFFPFNGPVLFTTNCIVPPRKEGYRERVFTTGSAGLPGAKHIFKNEEGKKDFTEIIEMAKTCAPPEELEKGAIVGGFAHNQVFALADKVVDAVKSGAIKKFIVMAGCDGRMNSRKYYTEFAEQLPKDTVILTAGCAKYRYNKLDLGDIGGIPRVLDAGQCNDSYSLAVIAMKLKEVFELDDINDLPIVYNIAWYEQKAVIVLLALLYLGVKNIHLGPTLPGFLSPNVANVLVESFGIGTISTPEDDINKWI
jgi:hydroxylamine reductase